VKKKLAIILISMLVLTLTFTTKSYLSKKNFKETVFAQGFEEQAPPVFEGQTPQFLAKGKKSILPQGMGPNGPMGPMGPMGPNSPIGPMGPGMPPQGPPPQDIQQALIHLAKILNLSEEQIKKIKSIFFEAQKEEIKKGAEVQIAELELRDYVENNDPLNLKEVENKVKKLTNLKGEMLLIKIKAFEDAKNVLTKEQREKFKKILAQRHLKGKMKKMMMGGKKKFPNKNKPLKGMPMP